VGKCDTTRYKREDTNIFLCTVPPTPPLSKNNERITRGTYYYLLDDLGSVLKVVDSSGNVKNSYYYDPFGNSLNKSETVSNPWQFASGL